MWLADYISHRDAQTQLKNDSQRPGVNLTTNCLWKGPGNPWHNYKIFSPAHLLADIMI